MDELTADFIAETQAGLAGIEPDLAALTGEHGSGEAVLRIVRTLHTIKGSCGFLKLTRIAALAHACEGALLRWRDGRGPYDTPALAHTAIAQIKDIVEAIGPDGAEPDGDDSALVGALSATHDALDWAVELAAIRDRLLARASAVLHGPPRFDALASSASPPERAPVEGAWKALPALVQDLAAALGKPMTITFTGADTEIAATALAPLREAMKHIAHNCAAHGVETADERKARGKPEHGAITVSAARRPDGAVVIRVSDDGRGLDTARIRSQAISAGMVFASHAARMTPEQVHAFIFAPGVSTAAAVTTHSGRGVGLDAARANVEALGGSIAVESEPGAGATFVITLPPDAPAAQPAPVAPEAPIAEVA